MKRFRLIIFCVIAIIILSSCNNKKDNMYQITETYRILSTNSNTTYLSVDLPISYGYQSISNIEVLNADHYFFEQKDGYQTLNAHLQGDGEENIIILNYDISLSKGNINWDDNVNSQYLKPSEFIDSDNKNIVASAKSLIVENDDFKTAKNISEYVSNEIQFDYSEKINQDILKASEILDNKKGVCGDYSNLMTALLRAAGIPAKSVGGLVFNQLSNSSDWSSPAGSHAWVEFYTDGKWYFDDPTWGNRYFLNSDGYHLSYGASISNINSQEYKNVIHKLEEDGFFIIGAMTAPIKFIAWSDDENTTIVPRVDIRIK